MRKEFLEFFAGIGLLRAGLEKEGWICLFANDWNSKKARVYERNFGLGQMIEADIQNIEAEILPHATLATASFPCQDLSEAGLSEGIHGSRSSSFWFFTSLLRRMGSSRPNIVLLENVRGFLTIEKGSNLILAIKSLNNLGYACDVLLVDGKYFVPQSRPRIFVFGVLESHLTKCNIKLKNQGFIEHPFRTKQITSLMNSHQELKWFNYELPSVNLNGGKLADILDKPENVPVEYWFSDKKVNKHLKMMPTSHKKIVDELLLSNKNGLFTMYRRMRNGKQTAELRLDEIAGCLRSARGGSSKQFLVIVTNDKVRMRKFTISEIRRLMGVSDNFYLPDVYNDVYNELGEALIPSVIEWIAKNILNPLSDS